MASIMWGSTTEVLDPPAGLRAEDAHVEPAQVEPDPDEPGDIDWDDPESWYDEGGSGLTDPPEDRALGAPGRGLPSLARISVVRAPRDTPQRLVLDSRACEVG
jgi:hypothetical protein